LLVSTRLAVVMSMLVGRGGASFVSNPGVGDERLGALVPVATDPSAASSDALSSAAAKSPSAVFTTLAGVSDPFDPGPTRDPIPRDPTWGEGSAKSYWIPALDIVGFQILLSVFNRNFGEEGTYDSDFSSIQDNLHSGWVIDRDPFAVNQFLHPYQGSIYHGFARSAGLNYWEALGYDFAGSTLWEVAGETDPPSLNDEITTTFGGSFLGEALFRMSNLLLEGGGESPGLGRSLGAGLISPSAGFNRLAFGDRFDTVYASHDPATFWSASAGLRHNARVTDVGSLSDVQEDEAVAIFTMDYGLPGKTGYAYDRPFDYFHFEATATSSTDATPENIMSRGLLVGSDYAAGDSYDGVWGLYGSYDYFAPELFSVSSTAVGLGTTGQWRISDDVTLQGTLMSGVGWTAVGAIADAEEDRNYRYGWSPQALIALRALFGTRVLFDITGRDYYVDGSGSIGSTGGENILRVQATLTVRVYEHHAVGLQFVASQRNSSFSDVPDTLQEVGALSLIYTYLGETGFGAVR